MDDRTKGMFIIWISLLFMLILVDMAFLVHNYKAHKEDCEFIFCEHKTIDAAQREYHRETLSLDCYINGKLVPCKNIRPEWMNRTK